MKQIVQFLTGLLFLFSAQAQTVDSAFWTRSNSYTRMTGIKGDSVMAPPSVKASKGKYPGSFMYNPYIRSFEVYDSTTARWYPILSILQDGLISGGNVSWTGTGLNFYVSEAVYVVGGQLYFSNDTTVTLAVADGTNPRQDVIALNNIGVFVLTGTPAADPAKPQVEPGEELELTSVLVNAGATTPSGITQTIIWDENTESTATTNPFAGFTINPDNTTNPLHLTKAIDLSSHTLGGSFKLVMNTPVDLLDYSVLVLYVRLKSTYANGTKFILTWSRSSGGSVSNVVTVGTGDFGYVRTVSGMYQTIQVPMSVFAFTTSPTNVDRLDIGLTGAGAGMYIDYIQLQSGVTIAGTGVNSFNSRTGNVAPVKTDYAQWFCDTSYRRADSVFCLKNGVEYFQFKDSTGSGSSYTFSNGAKESGGNVTAGGAFDTDSISYVSNSNKTFRIQSRLTAGTTFMSDWWQNRSIIAGQVIGSNASTYGKVDINSTGINNGVFSSLTPGGYGTTFLNVNAFQAAAYNGTVGRMLKVSPTAIYFMQENGTSPSNEFFADSSKHNIRQVYGDNYRSLFTPFTLVDKGYVDSLVGGGGSQTLQQVLTTGSTLTQSNTINNGGFLQIASNGKNQFDSISINPSIHYIDSGFFAGTSITAGVGASSVGNRFSARVSQRLGMIEKNVGTSGGLISVDGITATELNKIPTYVTNMHRWMILEWGTNDLFFDVDTATFAAAYLRYIDTAIARGWPASKILLKDVVYRLSETHADIVMYNTCIEDIAERRGALFLSTYGISLIKGGASLFPDGIHPNDAGISALYVNPIIAKLGDSVRVQGQQVQINGLVELQRLKLRIRDTVAVGNYSIPLGMDSVGNVIMYDRTAFIENSNNKPQAQGASINITGTIAAGNLTTAENVNIVGGFKANYGRFTGSAPAGMTGSGVEIGIVSGNAWLFGYDRTGGSPIPLVLGGLGSTVRVGSPALGNESFSVSGAGRFSDGMQLTGFNANTTGSGLEMGYVSGVGYIGAYNRGGGSALNMSLQGVGGSLYFGALSATGSNRWQFTGTGHFSTSLFVGGTATPTAYIQPGAGTAAANTAPFKFTAGTNLTTPENGAVEYDGTDYFVTSGGTRYTLNRSLTGSASLDFGSTAANTSADLTITVTGAADGDVVSLGVPNASVVANSVYTAWVSAANTVTVRFSNIDALSAADPASGTFKVRVIK